VFDQVVEGVPVRAGSASVLFDAATGDLLALDSTGVPGADRAGTFPVTTIEQAVGLASDAFAARHGVLPTSIESYRPILLGPSLFEPGHPLVARGVALAWEIELSAPGERDAEGLPLEVRAFVSAEG